MASTESELLTIAQAATLLGESRQSTARRVVPDADELKAGELVSTRLTPKGAHLLQRADVMELAHTLAAEKRERLERQEAAIAGSMAVGS